MSVPAPPTGDPRTIVFGELAQRLEPRATPVGPTPAQHRPEEVRVLFRPEALGEATARALRSLPGARLERSGGLTRLTVGRAPLARLAGEAPEAACLLAAHDLAHVPAPPPRLMGVVNVTPDSFSDGGRLTDPGRAVEHGLKLAREGAEILDVGGESTRPGAAPVSTSTELGRVLPVVEPLARAAVARISIDTTRAEVAAAALDAGATIVNDVSAGRFDPDMLDLIAERGADAILMHMQGRPRDMQERPHYDDVVREVTSHLRERVAAGLKAGIDPSRIAIDPGIGFGKRLKDNLDLIRALPELRSLGLPIVLGVSRKTFLGRLSGEQRPDRRTSETLAALSIGCVLGADVHRVHDVASARAALDVAGALRGGEVEETAQP